MRLRLSPNLHQEAEQSSQSHGIPTGFGVEDGFDHLTSGWTTRIAHNEHIGTLMKRAKPKNTSRFVWLNKNGIKLYDQQGGELYRDCIKMRELGIDYSGFSKLNSDTTNPEVRRRIHSAVNDVFEHNRIYFGSTTRQYSSFYKPGGTMSIVAGSMRGRVKTSENDYLGRWTRTVLNCKEGRRVAVYNVYTPCSKDACTAGDKTINQQLYSVYVEEQRSELDPRKNHFHDLQETVKRDVNSGYSVIMGGDFNVDMIDAETAALFNASAMWSH